MQVHVARQAILNRKKQTVAYELLFREGAANAFPKDTDSKVATSRLILNQHLNVGFSKITGGKRALINFCEKGIIDELPALLPNQEVIPEILEHATPGDALYCACQKLAENGYRLALDDFEYTPDWNRFFKYIRLIKFDIQVTPLDDVAPQMEALSQYKNIKFLAEKVETQEDFQRCMDMGFEFFQGYFFCKPEMIANRDISANYHVVMAVYSEILQPNISYDRLTASFELDVSLTYKLLKFINSAAFQLQENVSSIKQALIYLGEARARQFITLIATAHLAEGKPLELIKTSIIRAKMCELVAARTDDLPATAAFLLGLFSLVDAILDKPMEEIVASLPFDDEIKNALLGFKCPMYHLLSLVKAYESGSWYQSQRLANVVQISESLLPIFYKDALAWSETYEKATQTKR